MIDMNVAYVLIGLAMITACLGFVVIEGIAVS